MRNIFTYVIITLVGCLIISMPAHADKGVVRITCDQEADVFINGKQKGECGDTSLDLALKGGKYSLVVRKDKKDGSYMYFEKQIFVDDDAIQKLSVKLRTLYTEEFYWERKRYELLIDRYPKGKHAAEAKRLIEAERTIKADEKWGVETRRDGRFIAYDNGTVLDIRTNLMWAAKDNGSDINWANAKSYCENYRGGGYTDWRMPTHDELTWLYDASKSQWQTECDSFAKSHVATDLIHLTCFLPWASETRGSDAAYFRFDFGIRNWSPQSDGYNTRALPVRSGK